ncbi:hypothetical protein KBB49_00330 [Candidatus Saccharibacteria bacterium]|nr:hypothetical protein [Candidatus Saccharibacteria bacterium]
MPLLYLSNPELFYAPEGLVVGAKYPHSIDPACAISLGKGVIFRSRSDKAYIHPPTTHRGASQPEVHKTALTAWLRHDIHDIEVDLLDPELEETKNLNDYADTVDRIFGVSTTNRRIVILPPRAVISPRTMFGRISMISGLLNSGDMVWHDQGSFDTLAKTTLEPGDIVAAEGSIANSIANTSISGTLVFLEQTCARNSFTFPVGE